MRARRARLPDKTREFQRFALIAGRRGGKTRIGSVATVEEATVPNTRHWACAPSYPELNDYVMPAVLGIVPQGWIDDWIAGTYTLKLKNKTQIQFRSLDDPERARGPGLHSLWIDEGRKIQELAWDTARPALTEYRGACWVTTSPNGKDWVYRRFYEPAKNGRPGFWAVRYKTIHNPAIPREEVEAARAEMDPLWFAQEYEGDFVTFTGAVYGRLLESQILKTDEDIKKILPEWPRIDPSRHAFSSLDPGTDHPFAGVLFLVTEFGLVVFREYLERNKPISEHVANLQRMEAPFQIERRGIDRSQKQFGIELAQHGFHAIPAENDVIAGIQRVTSWLHSKQLWFVERFCPKTVEQMRNYRWDENWGKDGVAKRERVIKRDDDLPDAIRYGCMLYPELPRIITLIEGRDPRSVPEEARWAWERLKRIEDGEKSSGLDWGALNASAMFGEDEDDPFNRAMEDLAISVQFGEEAHPIGDFYS